ncbi:MAG: secretin N-terminal domain-containing protein, partial [Acidobacteriota bacterium]
MSRIVISGPQVIIDAATELIGQFDVPGSAADRIEIAFIPAVNMDPAELIELLDPLLSMKIEVMISSGELAGDAVEAPADPKGPQSVRGKTARGSAVTSRAGKRKGYHLAPDEQNSRIVMAAPQVVIDEARALVAELDQQSEAEEIIFKTVALQNTQPAEMAKALREVVGKSAEPGRRTGRKGPADTSVAVSGEGLTVVEAPSGGALILRGPAREVQQAEEWIQTLDQEVTGDRVIKIYEIAHADIKTLVDVIMYNVDTPTSPKASPTRKGGARPVGRRPVAEPEEEEGFTTTITRVGTDVYIQADLIDDTILVSAPLAKIAQIDEIVAQLDPPAGEGAPPIPTKTVPKITYTLEHKDAFDAAFGLEAYLAVMWDYGDKPRVDYLSFGSTEMLVVEYPDKDLFPEIERIIRELVDVPDPEDQVRIRKVLPVPPDMSPEQVALWLKMNHPEYDIDVIDISATEDTDYNVEELKPYRRPQANAAPCVLPGEFQRTVDALLVSLLGPPEEDEPEKEVGDDPEPAARNDEPPEEVEPEPPVEDYEPMLESSEPALAAPGAGPADEGGESRRSRRGPGLLGRAVRTMPPSGEKLKVYYDSTTGAVIIEGESGILKGVDDWMDDLKEEIKDLNMPPDIRVLQVRHVDVYHAAEVINEMFNATQQQRQAVTTAQRRAQQQQAQLQAQQRRQQQQQQQQQQEGRGQQPGQQPGRDGRGQQPQVQIPELPPESVRIFPNPRDRTLIVRADSTQFTVIMRLLATIDRPQPIESLHRVFQLKKLNAVEVEELLRDWLGLDEEQTSSRPRVQQPVRRGQRGGQQQNIARGTSVSMARLPQPLMQQTLTAGELGVDPRDIKLSSNEAANTILVMAPKVALDYIEGLINELEGQDIQERIWRNYELQYADVEEVEEYLTSRFGDDADAS